MALEDVVYLHFLAMLYMKCYAVNFILDLDPHNQGGGNYVHDFGGSYFHLQVGIF